VAGGEAESYAFDNDAPEAAHRHHHLAEILDGPTIQCLFGLGELVGARVEAYYDLLVGRLLPAHGNDPAWAGQVHAAMLTEGLTDVRTVVQARSWAGGTAGALLMEANVAELRAEFLEAGMGAAQLDRLRALARDPRFVVRGYLTYSTTGRRSHG
jgi:hypothetical protein